MTQEKSEEINLMRPEEGSIQPGEFPLNPERLADFRQDSPAHSHDEYMPMTRGEFCRTDLAIADSATRINYLRMRVRMVRDKRENAEAQNYFNAIEEAYESSFETVTPDLLADPSTMNLIRCVDPYTDKQLDELQYPAEAQIKLPGGLGWFDATGLLYDWVAPRIFNPELAAGMHRNCGGFAILGALTGERQAAARSKAEENAKRITLEVAAAIRQEYVRRKGYNFDPQGAEILSSFGGPRLTFATGDVGTAENFITPKSTAVVHVEENFTPREIVEGVDTWINQRIQHKVGE